MIVHRDGPIVRLYSRNAYDWTARLSAIAAAAELIKAKSFTIDGEAVVLGPCQLAARRYRWSRPRSAASRKRTGSRSPSLTACIILWATISRTTSGWSVSFSSSQAASRASVISEVFAKRFGGERLPVTRR
jgi:hypothetical protein